MPMPTIAAGWFASAEARGLEPPRPLAPTFDFDVFDVDAMVTPMPIFNVEPMPAPQREQGFNVVQTAADVDFYGRAYWGAFFHVGQRVNHDQFMITPRYLLPGEIDRIVGERAHAGVRDPEYGLRRSPTFDSSQPPMRATHRAKLPREPVEALPLPG